MDAATPATPATEQPKPEGTPILTAWPRSAQAAMALLIALSTVLLAIHAYGYLRWGTKPTELARTGDLGYRIDLNRADRAELLQLPGVGENLAQRIEEYRREHGAFRTVGDLTEVHGIGPATLERLRPWLQVERQRDQDGRAALAEDVDRPAVGEQPRKQSSKPKASGSKEAKLRGPINVNTATAEELQRLPGIGPKLSGRIVDERAKKIFRSVEDLRRVAGIGPKVLARLRPYVKVDNDSSWRVAINGSE